MLNAIDRIVASSFKTAHGIIAVPLQQLVDGPSSHAFVGTRTEHDIAGTSGKVTDASHISGGKIEINACKVALVLVSDLKHGTTVTAKGTRAQFARAIGGTIVAIT